MFDRSGSGHIAATKERAQVDVLEHNRQQASQRGYVLSQ
jgi:hypothetical protein